MNTRAPRNQTAVAPPCWTMSASSGTRKAHTAQDGIDVIVVERITVRDKITETAKDLTGKVSGDRGPSEDPDANNRRIDRRGCVFAEHCDKEGPRSRGRNLVRRGTASPAATALR